MIIKKSHLTRQAGFVNDVYSPVPPEISGTVGNQVWLKVKSPVMFRIFLPMRAERDHLFDISEMSGII
jgi:hypothetical protein